MLHGGWVHLHEKDSLLEEGVPVTRQGMKKYSGYPDHQGALGLVVCPQPMQPLYLVTRQGRKKYSPSRELPPHMPATLVPTLQCSSPIMLER